MYLYRCRLVSVSLTVSASGQGPATKKPLMLERDRALKLKPALVVDGFDLHVRTQIFSHGCSRLETDFLVHAIGWMSVWRRLRSESSVHLIRRQDGLNVIENGFWFAQGAESGGAHRDELAVGDGEDAGVVGGGAPPLPRPLPHQGGGVIWLARRRPILPPPPVWGRIGERGNYPRLTRYRPTVSCRYRV